MHAYNDLFFTGMFSVIGLCGRHRPVTRHQNKQVLTYIQKAVTVCIVLTDRCICMFSVYLLTCLFAHNIIKARVQMCNTTSCQHSDDMHLLHFITYTVEGCMSIFRCATSVLLHLQLSMDRKLIVMRSIHGKGKQIIISL